MAGLEGCGRENREQQPKAKKPKSPSHRDRPETEPEEKAQPSTSMLGAKYTATPPLPAPPHWPAPDGSAPDRLSQDGGSIALFLFRTSLSSIQGLNLFVS